MTVADSRTKLTIRVGVAGDESRSHKILDAIKRHSPEGNRYEQVPWRDFYLHHRHLAEGWRHI
ncbi:MAG: DUF3568 family protein [Nitrospirales bacterium]|nr:DUF3568 family protein [Nitrospirales bacterium]